VDAKLNDLYLLARRELRLAQEMERGIITRVQLGLREAFLDAKKGPVFAAKLINGAHNACVLARIGACIAHLQEKAAAAGLEIERYGMEGTARLEEAAAAFFLTREAKKTAYIQAKTAEYTARLGRDMYLRLVDVYKAVAAAAEALAKETYTPVLHALEELRAAPPAAPPKEGRTYFHDLINADQATEDLRATCVDFTQVDFAKEILENPADFMARYVQKKFAPVLQRPLSAFLAMANEGQPVDAVIENVVAPRLYRDALPIFHLENIAGIHNFPQYGVVSVPADCPEIIRGIENYRGHALANLRFTIRTSTIRDRIFWLNTQNGVPLAAYTPLKMYEDMYLKMKDTRESIGRDFWPATPSPL
jgi:hypothetical protein